MSVVSSGSCQGASRPATDLPFRRRGEPCHAPGGEHAAARPGGRGPELFQAFAKLMASLVHRAQPYPSGQVVEPRYGPSAAPAATRTILPAGTPATVLVSPHRSQLGVRANDERARTLRSVDRKSV